jgi:hypothetical protein
MGETEHALCYKRPPKKKSVYTSTMETCSQPVIIVVCCLFENAVAVKAKLHFTVILCAATLQQSRAIQLTTYRNLPTFVYEASRESHYAITFTNKNSILSSKLTILLSIDY